MGGLEAVLIIDPDERRRAFARDVLDRAGYDVRAADDEGEVAGLLAAWQPTLVVTPLPPSADGLSSCPVVVTATPRAPVPDSPRVTAVAAPFDRAGLLAAVWVTLNP